MRVLAYNTKVECMICRCKLTHTNRHSLSIFLCHDIVEGESKDVVAEESVDGINLDNDSKNTLNKSPPPAANVKGSPEGEGRDVAEELVGDNDLKNSIDKSTPLATDDNKESPGEPVLPTETAKDVSADTPFNDATPPRQKYEIDTRLAKSFQYNGAQKIFSGYVTGYDANTHKYFILYEDGDQEAMEEAVLDDLILFDNKGNIAKKKKKQNDNRVLLAGIEWRLLEAATDQQSGEAKMIQADGIVNDMIKSKEYEIYFRYAKWWQIDDGRGRFRARVGPNIVNTEKIRAYLEVPVNSVNGGRICFNLCADVGEYTLLECRL